MATLSARLAVFVDDTVLRADVAGQVDLLAVIGSVLAALDGQPPDELQDLLDLADDLPLPDLGAAGDLAAVLDGLLEVVPTDLDELTGPLAATVTGLVGGVGDDVVAAITGAMATIQTVQALLDVDLTCAADGSGGVVGVGGGNGGDGGNGGNGSNGGGGGDGGGGETATVAAADRAATMAGLADVVLDTLPEPLDVPGLLGWLAERVDIDDFGVPLGFPMLDDLREPVQRLVSWDGMSGAAIRDELATTLHAVGGLLDDTVGAGLGSIETATATMPADLDAASLDTLADDLVASLTDLAAAVESTDGAAVAAQVDVVTSRLDLLEAAWVDLEPHVAGHDDLIQAMRGLGSDLERRMGIVDTVLVGSTGIRGVLGTVADTLQQQATAEAVDDVLEQVRAGGAWLSDLLAAVDLGAISDPITEAGQTVTTALDDLDAALLAVAAEIRSGLESATDLLDQVDPAALRQSLDDALDDVADELASTLDAVAAPARTAVQALVDAADQAVDTFDPAQVVAALTDIITAVTDVLEDPEVLGAVLAAREAIDQAVGELADAPITPVTDAVVAAIDEVADLLRSIETSLLPGPAKLALQAALSALPDSLDPVTDPLVDALDDLIDAGPIPLLERVRQGPAEVAEQLRAFDPAAMVGPVLSQPWQALVDQAESVGPAALFDPVAGMLDDLRARLADELDPSAVLAPLAGPHRQVLAAVDAIDPGSLLDPIETALAAAAAAIRTAVGDDLLAPVERVTAAVTGGVDAVRSVLSTLQRVRQVLGDLAGLDQALVDWVDAIFAKLAATPDDGTVAAAVEAVSDAVEATTSAALLARLDDTVAPVRSRLDTLRPGDRLADLAAAHRAITPADVAAVPAGAARDALQAILDRSDPVAVDVAAPWRALADLRVVLADEVTPAGDLGDWDGRHHGPDGVLADYGNLSADPAVLGQHARTALDERFVEPVLAVVRIAGPVAGLLAGLAEELALVLAAADERLADLLAAPAAFTAIRDEVVDLADRVEGADLAVLTDAVAEVTGVVRGGLAALDPATLADDVSDALDRVLAVVSLDVVVPPGDLADLEDGYGQVVDALKALDPAALVTDVVGPAYDEAVAPLIDAIDLTPTIDGLVARLDELPDELRAELDRVDEAYQELLRAAPSIDLTDLAIDLDIEVDIDVPSPF